MPPIPDPLLGSTVDGKYQIAERIGGGGMGTVYRAVHVSLGAPRALKVMRRELAGDPALIARFQTEARLAESLRHPNLVAVFDFGQLSDGGWYIVSEYVEGASLAVLMKRREARFCSGDVARFLGQIAGGLALAHRKGIVHRDISPDNIMLAADEHGVAAKLLDFGVAKDTLRAPGDVVTGVGWNMGKVGFSSPEQMGLLREGETVDGRCDVFSLAAVAYLMLSGRLPWRKDDVRAYTRDLLLRPAPELEAEIRMHAPEAWRGLFVDALARSRDRRVEGMAALSSRMQEAASSAQPGMEPPPFSADRLRGSGRDDGILPLATQALEPVRALEARELPTPVSMAALVEARPRVLTPSSALLEEFARSEARASASEKAGSPQRRLIVLEDDAQWREMLPGLLEGPDLTVTASPWRADAASFAAEQEPDLILLDVETEVPAAKERVRRLRRHPGLEAVPVVLFSSADEWTLRALAHLCGASGYLPKAAFGSDARAAVRRLLAPGPRGSA